uniref:Uncharacterized protein n=1 Tax=Tanacetum cinerariifolium TaxID=118510 RepID=A0A6L2KJ88_TANCI|nr:hypothetical protein [Tanacetum cinerariifolium]
MLFTDSLRQRKTRQVRVISNHADLERQLNKETLHEKDSISDLRVIKVQFDQFIHSKVLEPSNYNSYDLETRQDFKEDTQMEPQTFKEAIIQNMDTIEQCIVEIEVKASDASLENKDCSRIVSDKRNDQGLENQSNTSGDESSRSRNECNDKSTYGDDTDIKPSYDTEPMVETDQNAKDERVTLANLVANLKLDVDENKMIQKQLKKANSSLTQELKECKSTLVETSRTLGV